MTEKVLDTSVFPPALSRLLLLVTLLRLTSPITMLFSGSSSGVWALVSTEPGHWVRSSLSNTRTARGTAMCHT